MSEQTRNLLDYIVVCINEFAEQKQMETKEAYLYLSEYKGIDFLKEFYDVEHTLSFDDTISDLTKICINNGGSIA